MWYRHAVMNMLKSFVLWLLIAVIPLQGIAANAVMTCKAAHQHAQQLPEQGDDSMHGHYQHAGHVAMLESQEATGDVAGDKADHFGSPGGSCTTFCPFAIWMHVDDPAMPIVANSSDRISYLPFHVPFVIPDAPEHRPRFLPT